MKVVCDTNISISGILWRGSPNKVMKLAERGKIEICITPEILEEFERTIQYPRFQKRIHVLKTTPAEITSFYESLVTVYKTIQIGEIVVKEDPDDDIFIGAAIISGARIIVSGDQHLLKIKKYHRIQILDANEFLQFFNKLMSPAK